MSIAVADFSAQTCLHVDPPPSLVIPAPKMSVGILRLVLGAALMTVGCGGDDGDFGSAEVGPNDSPAEATEVDSEVPDAEEGDASAELTIADQTYRYEPYLEGCQSIGDTTAFVGHGTAPGGEPAELSISYAADPPGSDLPGGEWELTATRQGDTPGIATGEELYAASPGLLRTDDDGFIVESTGSTIRISGPAENASTGSEVESNLALECR